MSSISPDPFGGMSPGLLGPRATTVPITPADQDLPKYVTRVIVLSGGSLAFSLRNDVPNVSSTVIPVVTGQVIDLYFRRIWATGTTAQLVGFY